VIRQLRQARLELHRVECLGRLGDPAVQAQPAGGADLLVERLADQRVREAIAPRGRGKIADDPRALRLLEKLEHGVLRQLAHLREHGQLELAPDHRGDAEHAVALLGQRAEPSTHHLAHALGNLEAPRLDRLGALEPPVGLEQLHHLVHEEGIALRLPVDRLDERLGGHSARAEFDEARHVGGAETAQQHPLAELAARQLGQGLLERVLAPELHVAVGPEQQQTRGSQLLGEKLQQQERGPVRPVQVVDHQRQGLALGGVLEEGGDAVEEAKARLLGLELRGLRQTRQPLAHLGDHLGDVGRARAHLRHQRPRLSVVDVGADDLHPGPVGGGSFALVAAAPQNLCAAKPGVGGELLGGAGLPDPRLADQHENPAAPRERVVEGAAKVPQLLVASHEDTRRQPVERVCSGALLGRDDLGANRSSPGQLLAHRRGARRALARVLGQQPQDQSLERARNLGVVPGRRHRGGVDVLADHRHHVVPQKRRPARHHLVEHGAQRVEIRADAHLAREGLLGGHVGGGADHHPLLRDPRAVQRQSQAEVTEPGAAVFGEPDVPGLQVPVDHTAFVRVLEGMAELFADAQHFPDGEPPALGLPEADVQVAPGHVLAHDVELPLVLADVVDGDDVGVVAEAPHRLRLAADPDAAGLVQALGLDQRQRDVAVEPLVPGQVDALLGSLAHETLHPVAAGGKRGRSAGLRGGCFLCRSGKFRATLAAELELRRVLESAARAGPRQRRAAAAAELEAARVLESAARAAHDSSSRASRSACPVAPISV
jgi:hypothetical protein